MNTARPRERSRLLRWIFRRGQQLLVCELAQYAGDRHYRLSLVPQWDKTHAATESFDPGMSAFQRHAAIATTLRESGWNVVAYTDSSPFIPDRGSALDRRAA